MLEVGNTGSAAKDRSHFGGWAIVSSPLILGVDLTDDSKLLEAWPTISNVEVIAVNQQWAGHPGYHVRSFTPPSVGLSFVVPAECNGSSAQARSPPG